MKVLKTIGTLLGLFLSAPQGIAQVKWYPIEEAERQAATQGKKIMVKVYANWCGWCKEMDKATFPNVHVAKLLNQSFIPVQFNSEQLGDIVWGGTTYKVVRPKKSGRYHQLAAQWLNGRMSYPTIVILDANGRFLKRGINDEAAAPYFCRLNAPAVSALEKAIRWENGWGGSGRYERIFFDFFA